MRVGDANPIPLLFRNYNENIGKKIKKGLFMKYPSMVDK